MPARRALIRAFCKALSEALLGSRLVSPDISRGPDQYIRVRGRRPDQFCAASHKMRYELITSMRPDGLHGYWASTGRRYIPEPDRGCLNPMVAPGPSLIGGGVTRRYWIGIKEVKLAVQ